MSIRYVLGTTEVKVRKGSKPPQIVLHYWVTSSEPGKTVYPERIGVEFDPKRAKQDIPIAKKLAAEVLKINPRQIEIDTPLERYCG